LIPFVFLLAFAAHVPWNQGTMGDRLVDEGDTITLVGITVVATAPAVRRARTRTS